MAMQQVARFFHEGMKQFGGITTGRVLDFGCGAGHLVDALADLGLDAHGCDIETLWAEAESPRFRLIEWNPYRVPYDDATFDAVVSTGVLEHAQNLKECLREISRVLKPGGLSMHLFPSRWYLPREPHISVPFANYFWPRFPEPWFVLWARLGVRGPTQDGMSWQEVVDGNRRFLREGVIYVSNRERDALCREVFGECLWPTQLYIENLPGRGAALFRKLPFKRLSARLLRELRTAFMVSVKRASTG